MKKVFEKLGYSLLIVIATIVIWIFFVFITTNGGTSRRFAPWWVNLIMSLGFILLIRVWVRGWGEKKSSVNKYDENTQNRMNKIQKELEEINLRKKLEEMKNKYDSEKALPKGKDDEPFSRF